MFSAGRCHIFVVLDSVFALLEHLNQNTGAYAIVLGAFVLTLLLRLLAVQTQTLQILRNWEADFRAIEQQRLAKEQEQSASEAAQLAERLAREQAVHQSRESMADATALLHQLKRQFG